MNTLIGCAIGIVLVLGFAALLFILIAKVKL